MAKVETKRIAIKGKCMWARVHSPRSTWDAEQNGGPDTQWEIEVECSDALFAKLKKAGIHSSSTLKEYEGDPLKYLKLKASAVKTTRGGEVITFDKLPVLDIKQQPFSQDIGNGSTVNCIVDLAKLPICTAMRLRCVQVIEHVAYDGGDSGGFSDLLEGESVVDAAAPVDDSSDDDVFM